MGPTSAGCLARVAYSDAPTPAPLRVVQDAVDAAGYIIASKSSASPGRATGERISQTVYISKSLTLEGGYDSQFNRPHSCRFGRRRAGPGGGGDQHRLVPSVIISRLILTAATRPAWAAPAAACTISTAPEREGERHQRNQARLGGGVYNVTGTLSLAGATGLAHDILSNTAVSGGGLPGRRLAGHRRRQHRREPGQPGRRPVQRGASPASARRTSTTIRQPGRRYLQRQRLLSGQIITATGHSALNGGAVYNAGASSSWNAAFAE